MKWLIAILLGLSVLLPGVAGADGWYYSHVETGAAPSGVSRTGDLTHIHSNANADDQSVTVPADATIAIVGVGGYDTSAAFFPNGSVTLGGDSLTLIRSDTADTGTVMTALWRLVNPKTGSQTLAWDWDGDTMVDAGAHIFIAFYKGVDTSSPIRDDGGQQVGAASGTATTGALTASSGDMFVGVGEHYGDDNMSWTNATELADDLYNQDRGSFAEESLSGNVTVSVSAGSSYTAISGAVLKQS